MFTMGPWTFPTSGEDDRIMYKENHCTKKITAQKNLNDYCSTLLEDSASGVITFSPGAGVLYYICLY
jgi:hypothetical protein